jgi:hypothetical protein
MTTDGPKSASPARPDFFFSYSTAETTNVVLSTLLWIVFHEQYDVRLTPSALTSGASQLQKIEKEISECSFGVVCLDGLRPNVVHEWGFMRGQGKPVILLKKEDATVDVRHLIRESAPQLQNPSLDMNVHLSNLKDINYATWYPDDPQKSARAIWEEYNKVREQFSEAGLLEVEEPHLW